MSAIGDYSRLLHAVGQITAPSLAGAASEYLMEGGFHRHIHIRHRNGGSEIVQARYPMLADAARHDAAEMREVGMHIE